MKQTQETNPKAIIGSGVGDVKMMAEESAGGLCDHNEPVKFCYERNEHINGFINGYNKSKEVIQSLRDSNAELLKALEALVEWDYRHNEINFIDVEIMNKIQSAINKAKSLNQ